MPVPDFADIGLIGIITVPLLVALCGLRIALRGQFMRVRKYPLFKVRDDLVYLVATDKLRESDFIFRSFDKAVTYWIQDAEDIHLRSLLEARLKGLDPAEQARFEKIIKALETRDPEVRMVVHEFYTSMLRILRQNSRVTLFVLSHAGLPILKVVVSVLQRIATAIERRSHKRRRRPLKAYAIYRDYSHADCALAA